MDISKKIAHLPVLNIQDTGRGPIGYFNHKPVEIGELTFPKTTSGLRGSYEKIPQRRICLPVLGRTIDGMLITGNYVNDKTGLVEEGNATLGFLDYRTIAPYK